VAARIRRAPGKNTVAGMTYVETVAEDAVTGRAAELFAAYRDERGYVPNFLRLFAARPAVFDAWRQLLGAIRRELDDRRYLLATLAAAQELRSTYCAVEHGVMLRDAVGDPEAVRRIAADPAAADLSIMDRAVMDFAGQVARDAAEITAADIDRLRAVGLSDGEIFDVKLAAAARCFFSTALHAMGAGPDPQRLTQLDPALRAALTGPYTC
jgi:uncharacterized peroxidase-related enzyme